MQLSTSTFVLGSLLLLGPLAAQNVYVQPAGYAGVEGNSSTTIPLSSVSGRVHQADSGRIGLPMPMIRSLAFRRDRSAGATATARTVDITILMGKTNIATFSNTFANNWLGQPVTVYTKKPTNLPDITMAPPAPPGPFVIQIPLDTPYNYDGVDSFLWELQIDSGSTNAYSMDWVSAATTTNGATATALGTGCTTANGTMSHTATASANEISLNLSFSTSNAPASAPLFLLFGLTDPNLPVPGACTNLHSDALLVLPLGTSSATGALASVPFSTRYVDTFAGVDLCTQVVAPDASQPGLPLAASNGRRVPLPLTRGGPVPTTMRRTYSQSSSSAATGSTVSTSAIVTEIVY